MDIVRAAAGVSESREKVSVSLTTSAGMDDESCAGGWGSMVDTRGAMSIIVDDCTMFFSRIEEAGRQFLHRIYGGTQYIQVVPQQCIMFVN